MFTKLRTERVPSGAYPMVKHIHPPAVQIGYADDMQAIDVDIICTTRLERRCGVYAGISPCGTVLYYSYENGAE